MLTRQHLLLEGGLAIAFAALLTVLSGHTHGCKPVATTFLSVQVGRQHLRATAATHEMQFVHGEALCAWHLVLLHLTSHAAQCATTTTRLKQQGTRRQAIMSEH
jgi:hypothetical protein